MQVDERFSGHPSEELIRRAARDELGPGEQSGLDRHLVACATCAAELEARRIFHVSLAREPLDDARDSEAVERAMAQITGNRAFDTTASKTKDNALNRVAIDRAMSILDERGAHRVARRRLVRSTAGFAAVATAAAAAIVFALLRAPATTTNVLPAIVLSDGSEIAAEGAATPVQITEQTPVRTTVRLPAGAARFRVRHDTRRLFRVDAGSIQIDDLGTVFRVAHEAAGRVRVSVTEGRVAVVYKANALRVELRAGDDRIFSEKTDAPEPPKAGGPSLDSPMPAPVVTSAGPVRALPRVHGADGPADLLAAADVARASRRPRAAVAPLRRLIDHYPKDPRAPSALFTLGWIYLTDLNRPREAAVAFAEAERIAPRGALAEDAAARVAEAWQKAGESRRAADAAQHYTQAYPSGRYIALMRGLIGDR
jgi:transmembrane sensor